MGKNDASTTTTQQPVIPSYLEPLLVQTSDMWGQLQNRAWQSMMGGNFQDQWYPNGTAGRPPKLPTEPGGAGGDVGNGNVPGLANRDQQFRSDLYERAISGGD